jgi:cell division protein FtsB
MFSDKPPNLAQLNITQPYNTNHVAALEMIVKLAGENAVLQKENAELKEENKALKFEITRTALNTAAFKDGNNY